MRKPLITALLLFVSISLAARTTVLRIARVSPTDEHLNADIQNALLSSVVRALELHLDKPVAVETGADRAVTFRATRIGGDALLAAIVLQEGLVLEKRDGWLTIRDPKEPTVTLDVKDAEAEVILRELKSQCGIRNLMIDPEVRDRKGTFLFRDVPCTLALKVVFNSLGVAGQLEPNSILQVETPR